MLIPIFQRLLVPEHTAPVPVLSEGARDIQAPLTMRELILEELIINLPTGMADTTQTGDFAL